MWTIIGLRPKLRNIIILTSNRKLDRWKFRGYQNNRQNSVSRSESCSKIILSSIDTYSVSDQNLIISFLELLVYQNRIEFDDFISWIVSLSKQHMLKKLLSKRQIPYHIRNEFSAFHFLNILLCHNNPTYVEAYQHDDNNNAHSIIQNCSKNRSKFLIWLWVEKKWLHTIRKVKFLSKNSILTKSQHFHEFFTQIFFENFSREIKVVNS